MPASYAAPGGEGIARTHHHPAGVVAGKCRGHVIIGAMPRFLEVDERLCDEGEVRGEHHVAEHRQGASSGDRLASTLHFTMIEDAYQAATKLV